MDDGLRADHDEGPDEAVLELVDRALLGVFVLGDEVHIAGFFAESDRLSLEKAWGVGFLEEEEAGDLDCDVSNGRCPEYPAPACFLGNEAAGYGSDCWVDVRSNVDGWSWW